MNSYAAAATVALMLATGATISQSHSSPPSAGDLAGYYCEGCMDCANGTLGWAMGGDDVRWLETWWCPDGINLSPYTCEDMHECSPDLAAAVEEALNSGDPATLHRMTRTTPEVEFVASRRAIQVLDCAGNVSRHYLLDDSVFEELVAAQ